ncbi:MAG: sigma-70 family RNA polymerase sigma factor [Xenococcus sp. MO_188.B8]|nr:sigma-70 family RNA polymerase sigma factor [Xenococcus sp. MO_188.B8]
MSDEELVAQILKGDELAATYLILIICGSRLKFLTQQKFKTLNLEFDEVASDLFLHLKQKDWKALRDFRGHNKSGRSCKLSNYISLIASRLLWKKMEKAKKDIDWISPLYEVEGLLIPDRAVERNRLIEYVIDAVMSLENPVEREVLLLYKIEGRNVQEVAEILNIKPGNVYTRCTRALKNLRLLLEQGDVYV